MVTITGTEGLQCPFVIPDHDTPYAHTLSRWSDLHVSAPAIIVTPRSEQDIISAIQIAKKNKLSVLVGGCGHATFVPVNAHTLYLDMKTFQSVDVDTAKGLVRVGGGTPTGQILKELTKKGYYTCLPNSNNVGIVGCILGGGTSPMNGLHGYVADNVVSFRLVTANEDIVEVDVSSSGDKLALYHALCGAGHGLAAITSATLKIHPIAQLQLTEGKVWTRALIFPPAALELAVKTFLSFQSPPDPLYLQLTFARSPPGTPAPGCPMIILSSMYFGPGKDAEKATAALFQPGLVESSASASSAYIDLSSMNDALEPLNAHGGLKASKGARLATLNEEAMISTFAKWVSVTDAHPDAMMTAVIFHKFSATKLAAFETSSNGKNFIDHRNRGNFVLVPAWSTDAHSVGKLGHFGDDVLEIFRQGDQGPPRTIPNAMRFHEDMKNIFVDEKVKELRRLKEHWDPGHVFWSPYNGAHGK